ncbi:hypothetical protein VP01_1080g8 [Puccinia sorghi]|uniref:Uncharacterized protein n=1 Tax=Puccinia sorghi TaxID=27349 RepID=A0A0L6VTC3_9BASI|nr:hypothetical protein VP01_1080g8 [Puccinia sorghi]
MYSCRLPVDYNPLVFGHSGTGVPDLALILQPHLRMIYRFFLLFPTAIRWRRSCFLCCHCYRLEGRQTQTCNITTHGEPDQCLLALSLRLILRLLNILDHLFYINCFIQNMHLIKPKLKGTFLGGRVAVDFLLFLQSQTVGIGKQFFVFVFLFELILLRNGQYLWKQCPNQQNFLLNSCRKNSQDCARTVVWNLKFYPIQLPTLQDKLPAFLNSEKVKFLCGSKIPTGPQHSPSSGRTFGRHIGVIPWCLLFLKPYYMCERIAVYRTTDSYFLMRKNQNLHTLFGHYKYTSPSNQYHLNVTQFTQTQQSQHTLHNYQTSSALNYEITSECCEETKRTRNMSEEKRNRTVKQIEKKQNTLSAWLSSLLDILFP